ncbi:MFS transporter [Streptomyces albofaciens JCM 4342]|uniref:MFS transporter n=1 Tax=Streptomyces albofaciens TaxID=66866 RepID=UPI001239AE86|nr:MFS transporter [Streptomyces albofaciens]KAA6223854.1 MFS transporter [Streptomyces albofaciens JCM 4342]
MATDLARKYRLLFAVPGLRLSAVAALTGKFQPGMYPVALLALASDRLDYSDATLVVAAASFGAMTTPLRGRLLDRYPYTAVLWPLLVLHLGSLLLFVAAARARTGTGVLVCLSVLASVSMPPIGTLTRVMWRKVVPDDLRTTALALDSVLADFGFMVGPVAAVALARSITPDAALLACGLLVAVAVPLGLRGAGARAPKEAPPRRHWAGPLCSSALRRVFSVAFCFFLGVNIMEVSLASYGHKGEVTLAGGALLSLIAMASMAGAALLGGLPARAARRLMRPTVPLGGNAVCLLLLAAAGFVHPLLVPPACLPVGFCLGPCFASVYGTAADHAGKGEEAETQSWVAAAMMAGGALGAAVGGWALAHGGLTGALLLASAAWAAGAVCGARVPRLRPAVEGARVPSGASAD